MISNEVPISSEKEHDVYHSYYNDGRISTICCYKKNTNLMLHNPDGPAYVSYYPPDNSYEEKYYIDGRQHRDGDLPATIFVWSGTVVREQYMMDDVLHRENDLPADIIYRDGVVVAYYKYYKNNLHSVTGPAQFIRFDNGKINLSYYVNGKKLSQSAFNKKYFPDLYNKQQLDKPIYIRGKKYKVSHFVGDHIMLEPF